jgi:two-component system, chemotaxis family, chemotaxis protein CheV
MAHEIPSITGDILLDAGTNELEVLVFTLAGGHFGVNVAKVREVIKPVDHTAAPNQHASVLGMINIRGSVLPIVDLARHLGLRERTDLANGRIIITEFNGLHTGFVVDGVDQIHRMSWAKVRPAPDIGQVTTNGVTTAVSSVTGVVELRGSLVLMLDFESVADGIMSERRLRIETVENVHQVDRGAQRVIIAEDSPFMRNLIRDVFTRSGYTNLEVCSDGQQAWEAVQRLPVPACVVSDIEMPRMDGLYLTKRIKETPALAGVKVLLFSSLISGDNLKKGKQVGADMQVSKPELREMVLLVDRCVAGIALEATAAA